MWLSAMSEPQASDRIRQIIQVLHPYQPDRIYLFGSWALPVYTPEEFAAMQREGNAFAEMIVEEGRLVEIHEKYPVDTGHQKI